MKPDIGTSASAVRTKWRCCVAVPQFGMEMYARFAHKVLWHDFEPGWALHKSHHEPRTGPFEVSNVRQPLTRQRPASCKLC